MQRRQNNKGKPKVLIIGRRRRSSVVTVPDAPLNLSIEVEATHLALYWEHPGGTVDGFNVYRQSFSDGFVLIAQLGNFVTDWGDFNAEPGIVFTYYITAFNSAGESQASNTAQGEIMPTGE